MAHVNSSVIFLRLFFRHSFNIDWIHLKMLFFDHIFLFCFCEDDGKGDSEYRYKCEYVEYLYCVFVYYVYLK